MAKRKRPAAKKISQRISVELQRDIDRSTGKTRKTKLTKHLDDKDAAWRKCMRCRRKFWSSSKGNRRCRLCLNTAVYEPRTISAAEIGRGTHGWSESI